VARICILVLAAAALAMILALLPRNARGQGVYFDCPDFAAAIARLADFRDADADLDKVVRIARRHNPASSSQHLAAIEREIRRMWRERLPQELVAQRLFDRCRAQLGDMGMEG